MRVLITGSTGLLAKGFEETANEADIVVGIHLRDYRIKDWRVRHLSLDVRDDKAVEALFDRERFDGVIHAAGIASVDHVERHPEEGLSSNLQGTQNIARCCKKYDSYMVYISTNAVFNGEKAPYKEDDQTAPIHQYGKIKLACEDATREEAGAHCIVRPILMYGWNHVVTRPNPVTWIYEKLLRGENISLVNDIYENPLYNIQCGRALWAILRNQPKGIFHFAGGDRINRFELGQRVAKEFDLDSALIKEVGSDFFPNIAPRPKDTTFITDRMEDELGIKAMSLADGLHHMKTTMGIG